ncbi:unnamed protein product [Rotaria sp. Silwood2]|nr:unnamed protein product [Rotaria sp. Silwood2]CAF2914118.1 unnamed protein product [Rotaria sp. Silwood2]CAF3092496.1 unnamed protein product [Rotaria sp. Silwood2]CAF3966373.1 unnamed protein product [Rotaria sp. Silwood2]CAF4167023.1 unnamed protein product [Rotaria sp. Silwood2]
MTTQTVEVEHVETPYHNTQCLSCPRVCHENCGLDYTINIGDNIFRGCACMNGDYCRDCTHHYSKHVHVKFKYVSKTTTVPLLTDEEKKEMDSMTDTESQKQALITKMNDKITSIENSVKVFKNELTKALKQLKDLCPYYDYKLELNCAVKLLEDEELIGSKHHDPVELKTLKTYFTELMQQFDQAAS